MEQTVIELSGVTKKFGTKTVVDGLSFTVHPGELFGLLGPNGAGKTTTIRMMVGLIRLSAGDIFIGGHSIQREFIKAIAKVGAIVETPAFYGFLSGYQNLLHYANMVSQVNRGRIEEVVRLFRMTEFIHDPVRTYSLGMRQRLGIAQAILHKPRVLILDEPTNGLDPAGIKELREYLRGIAKEDGIAVIISSHLLAEMEVMGDRMAIIKNGKLLAVRAVGESTEKLSVSFAIDDAEGAAQTIQKFNPEISLSVCDGNLEAVLHREMIPEVVSALSGAGFKIYEVQPRKKHLEEVFMEMTADE